MEGLIPSHNTVKPVTLWKESTNPQFQDNLQVIQVKMLVISRVRMAAET